MILRYYAKEVARLLGTDSGAVRALAHMVGVKKMYGSFFFTLSDFEKAKALWERRYTIVENK